MNDRQLNVNGVEKPDEKNRNIIQINFKTHVFNDLIPLEMNIHFIMTNYLFSEAYLNLLPESYQIQLIFVNKK